MKKIILLPALLFFNISVFAQKNNNPVNSFRAGLNCAFFTSGDFYMPAVSVDYSRSLNKFLAISPRIIGAYHNRVSYGKNDFSSSLAAALSLRITPLPGVFDHLKIDVGGLYHHFKVSSTYILNPGRDNYANYNYSVSDLFGLIGSLSLNFSTKHKLYWGARLDMLTSFSEGYFNCDSWQMGIYLGKNF
jgi:hypothetical protein